MSFHLLRGFCPPFAFLIFNSLSGHLCVHVRFGYSLLLFSTAISASAVYTTGKDIPIFSGLSGCYLREIIMTDTYISDTVVSEIIFVGSRREPETKQNISGAIRERLLASRA